MSKSRLIATIVIEPDTHITSNLGYGSRNLQSDVQFAGLTVIFGEHVAAKDHAEIARDLADHFSRIADFYDEAAVEEAAVEDMASLG